LNEFKLFYNERPFYGTIALYVSQRAGGCTRQYFAVIARPPIAAPDYSWTSKQNSGIRSTTSATRRGWRTEEDKRTAVTNVARYELSTPCKCDHSSRITANVSNAATACHSDGRCLCRTRRTESSGNWRRRRVLGYGTLERFFAARIT